MPRSNRHNLSVEALVYDKAQSKYKTENPQISFVQWVSNYLLMNLERDDFMRQYAPFIAKIGIQENTLFLKDTKKDKIIEVRLVNNKLQCTDDDPIYLQYAIALPELARLKKNH